MAKAKIDVFRGTTFKGTINLRSVDACNDKLYNTYTIAAGSTLEMRFKATPPVTITDTAGEIIVINASKGQLSFEVSAVKTALMDLGTDLGVDLLITEVGGDVLIEMNLLNPDILRLLLQ
jgi:hypothetical protein